MNRRIRIKRSISVEIEKVYPEVQKLGELAARNFGAASERSRSQLTNLLSVANRAANPAGVVSHIKRQAGKHNEWNVGGFAQQLLDLLGPNLRESRDRIAGGLDIAADDDELLDIHVQLIRDVMVHLTAQYEFSRAQAGGGRGGQGGGHHNRGRGGGGGRGGGRGPGGPRPGGQQRGRHS